MSGDLPRLSDTPHMEVRETPYPRVYVKDQAKRVLRACYLNLVPWLLFGVVFAYLDRVSLSYAAPTFKRALHLDNVMYGFGSVDMLLLNTLVAQGGIIAVPCSWQIKGKETPSYRIVYLGYGLAMIPSTLMLQVVGAPYWLGIITVVWGIVCASMAAVTTPAGFYATRFFLGVAEAGTFPVIWFYLTLFFTQSEMSVATAMINGGASVSLQLVGAPLATGFLFMEGIGRMHGWQWMFLMDGLMTIVFGIAIAFALPKAPAYARFLSSEARDWLSYRQQQAAIRSQNLVPTSSTAWACFKTWKTPYIMVCWFIINVVQIGTLFFVPLMVQAMRDGNFGGGAVVKKNLTPRQQAAETSIAALIAALVLFPNALAQIFIAWSSKRSKERNLHTAIPLCLGGMLFSLVPEVVKSCGAVAGFVVLGAAVVGGGCVTGVVIAWPATFLQGDALLLGFPVFNEAAALGGFVGPYLLGALQQKGSYQLVMRVFGPMNVVAGILLFCFRPGNLEHKCMEDEENVTEDADAASLPPAKVDP